MFDNESIIFFIQTLHMYIACIFLSDKKLLLILHCNCLLLLNQYKLHICKHAGWLGNNCHRRHGTMGQGSKKIDLSPSESWNIFLNDQHKLHFTLDIAVIALVGNLVNIYAIQSILSP